jgi:alpha-L-rhamnosidase
MWEHYDATTLWEILPVSENDDKELLNDRSHSHPMQSGYDSWFYSGIAGISPNEKEPGFKKITFKPYLTQFLKEANASFESPNGEILSQWQSEKKSFRWKIKIPYGSTGEIWLPNNFNVDYLSINNKKTVLKEHLGNFSYIGEFKSGNYILEVKED